MMKKAILLILAIAAMIAPSTAVPVSIDAYGEIMRRQIIRIGVSKDYPPLNFNAGERGVEMDMARRLADFLGVKLELIPLDVGDYTTAIVDRRVDIVIGGFSRNLSRARRIWFSEPYLAVTPGVLVTLRSIPRTRLGDTFEEPPIRTVWDLAQIPGIKIAVKKGSVYEHLLESEFPSMPRVSVPTNEEGLELLKKGSVNGFIHDSLYLDHIFHTTPGARSSYVFLQGGGLLEQICIGLPFGDQVLKTQVDTFIREIIRLGLIDKWLKEHSEER
ncbi:MAG: amino acid ABC transporter substrate-binding protein [Chrysiogenales bacterium]|nr:MAG: amino acid ABC transporter substrate-binding protein [Chrysiogenales bacterium]